MLLLHGCAVLAAPVSLWPLRAVLGAIICSSLCSVTPGQGDALQQLCLDFAGLQKQAGCDLEMVLALLSSSAEEEATLSLVVGEQA